MDGPCVPLLREARCTHYRHRSVISHRHMCSSIVHISFAVLGTLTLGSSHCLSSHTEFLNALYKLVPGSRFFESRWHVPWSGKDESISLATKRIGFVVKGPTRDTAMRFPPHYLLFEDISRSKEDNPGEMIQGVLQECDGANVPAGGVIGMSLLWR
ncbi:hypothetical protein BDV98DRAFT_569699 [Pterulicium gracile]|uniref:Uncharacterized protein n=1 Tax=Pterulicium gracile TaxID=1884261 RepID=A0A5C3QF86_9AGAR|nr:hypothetical protein BDV98DRAFT_569699 [Pterula gracilis]